MTDKLIIETDITDWRDEAYRDELMPTNDEEIIDAISNGKSTAQLARATIVSRELGNAPDDILRPVKILWMSGAAVDIGQKVRSKTVTIETEDGKTYEAKAYIGKSGRPHLTKDDEEEDTDDGGPSYVDSDNPLMAERAHNYITRTVPGHIWERMKQLKYCDADYKAAARTLKKEIDNMVKRLD